METDIYLPDKPDQVADDHTKQVADDHTKQDLTDTTGDTSITYGQTKPKEAVTTDISPTDNQTKPNQSVITDSSSVDNPTKPNHMDKNDTSFTDVNLKPEKIEDVKEEGPKFHCELSDKEMVHKIALALLEGLSTSCVDMTAGDIFRSPGTVAADVRKEMLEYFTERSQSFVAETVILDGGPQEEKLDHPFDIISDFIDDFLALKRSLLSRVSGWLLSYTREDKIDDFAQELELNSFWLLDRREAVAQSLLKNVDFKNEFHCDKKFKTKEELEQHWLQCGFRTVMCENEGCSATFSASHMEEHDSNCPFKILPCEQGCPEIIMRREMDRHCITVCPMKLVNCPFYSIGCQATVPSCNIREHCSNDIRSHLLFALQYLHKGASAEDLGSRVEQIEQESSGLLAGMQGVRTFTNAVKNIYSSLGPLKIEMKCVDYAEDAKKSDSSKQPADKENEKKTSDSGEHVEDPKTPDSGEQPADKEKETKTSTSGECPEDKEDPKTSYSVEVPSNEDKDRKTSDADEPSPFQENDATLLDSDKHPTEEDKDTKISDSSKHLVDNERGMPTSGEHPEDRQKDHKTSESGYHSVDEEKHVKTSDSGEPTEDKEKDAKTPNSGEHPIDNEDDTSIPKSGVQITEKPEDAKKSHLGSGEHSAEHSGS